MPAVLARRQEAAALHGRRLFDVQRSRLLSAAVKTVDELGYADATVAHITARARVSRRTFYELFANREECLAAMLDELVALAEAEVNGSGAAELEWCERVRTGLWAILSFFDREPQLARVCVVQAARGGPAVLARRDEILAGLAEVIDGGRRAGGRGRERTRLTAEGLAGATQAIVYARILRGERRPLTGMLGELMGMIVLPYQGPAAARRVQARPAPGRGAGTRGVAIEAAGVAEDPLDGVTMRLTYRTARVLEGVAEWPGASNRDVGDRAGISDPGQVSKLLARLQRLGLLENRGDRPVRGEPNAWTLTERGERVTRSIRLPSQPASGVVR